jgi:hypothetical protein
MIYRFQIWLNNSLYYVDMPTQEGEGELTNSLLTVDKWQTLTLNNL